MWQSPPVHTRSPGSRSALLREHVRQERVARDVERDAEEDVGAALVDLAAQAFAARHVELEERVARREGHPRNLRDVPGAHDDPPRVRVLAEQPHDLRDLVDVAAVGGRPAPPLHAVDRAELAVRIRPFVPDRDAVLLQPADVRLAAQEPEQLVRDGREVHLLRRHEREALGQVEAHLVAEHAHRAGPGAVVLRHAGREDVAHEVLVLGHASKIAGNPAVTRPEPRRVRRCTTSG